MQKSGSVCHVVAAAVFHLTDISVMIIAYMIITAYLFFLHTKRRARYYNIVNWSRMFNVVPNLICNGMYEHFIHGKI